MKNNLNKNIFIIVFVLLLFSKYSIQKIKKKKIKIKNIDNSKKIPKIIHCTYHNKKEIPEKVWYHLKKYASDYKINFYDDHDCYHFIKDNYNIQYANIFKNLILGCHKADFFRYCVIYCKGGVYIDIKIQPKKEFNNIFDHTKENLLYTCLGSVGKKESSLQKYLRRLRGQNNGHIFQAILASYPGNKIFELLINDFFMVNNPHKNYHIFTYKFYDHLYDITNYHLYPGSHIYKDQEIILFKEINKKMDEKDTRDRHGGYYYVTDHQDKIIFRSRYIDFPWNDKIIIIDNPITKTLLKIISFKKIYKFIENIKNNKINSFLLK